MNVLAIDIRARMKRRLFGRAACWQIHIWDRVEGAFESNDKCNLALYWLNLAGLLRIRRSGKFESRCMPLSAIVLSASNILKELHFRNAQREPRKAIKREDDKDTD